MKPYPNSTQSCSDAPASSKLGESSPLHGDADPGPGYFAGLIDLIHLIRAQERDAFLKIAHIIEQCSIDYDGSAPTTRHFFRAFQNKLHHAICGKTAAKLILERADATQPNMGLQTWGAAPLGRIYKRDVTVAKNYLNENELTRLRRIVEMFLDFAELQAERKVVMHLLDWVDKLDAFLELLDYEVPLEDDLDGREKAILVASKEYQKYLMMHDHAFLRISRRLSA